LDFFFGGEKDEEGREEDWRFDMLWRKDENWLRQSGDCFANGPYF
jgi:hypothetical protein